MLDLSKNTSENDNLTVDFLIACLITKYKLSESNLPIYECVGLFTLKCTLTEIWRLCVGSLHNTEFSLLSFTHTGYHGNGWE